MLRGHTVSRTSPQGANATKGGAEVLLAISRELRESREWLLTSREAPHTYFDQSLQIADDLQTVSWYLSQATF